jgi:hypothetical protein
MSKIMLPAFAGLTQKASATEGASVAGVRELAERLSVAYGEQLASLARDMRGAEKYVSAMIDTLAGGADASSLWLGLTPGGQKVLSGVLRAPSIHRTAELANELAA